MASGGKNKGSSGSTMSNQFKNTVFGPQGSALENLWNQGFQQLQGNNFLPQIGEAAQQAATGGQSILPQTTEAYNQQLQGGAFGDTSDIRQKLLDSMGGRSNVGSMYESIVGGQGNEYIDPVIQNMQRDAAQNVQTLQGQNALDAAMAGQGGSSRQAMENAMITGQANRDLLNKESQLRAGAYDKDLAMKMDIARQADTGRQAEQDRLFNMLAGATNTQASAIGQMPGMQSGYMNTMSPWLQAQQASWNPMNNLANIIGPAIMEASGKGTGSSRSKSKGGSFGIG